jgi:hypothetical protein
LQYFIDVEERRWGGLPLVLAVHGVEYDREAFVGQPRPPDVSIDDFGVTTLLKVAVVKPLVRILEDGGMRTEVLN